VNWSWYNHGFEFMNMRLILEAKKPDEQVTAELQALYPQWDFSKAEYYFDDGSLSPSMKGQRYLNNLYCPIEDENGNPHGVSNNLKVAYLYDGKGGCRECRRLSMGPKRLDFDEYVKNFPKDKGYNFDQSTFYREQRGNTIRRYVKDVFCTKKDENGNTHGVFAKDGVNIDNLRQGKTGCPICRKAEGSIGAKKLNDILIEKGYKDFEKEKKFSDCKSGKETNRCTRLKFDFYLKDKENREILVEYDGEQHFRPNAKHRGEEGFRERVINDGIKNRYTSQNNIKLIRIAYTDFNNIEKELLAGLESPNQLYLSSTYPSLGWNDPKLVQTQSSESKIKKDYVLTESQLRRIIESDSEEKLHSLIKQYLLKRYPQIKDVYFKKKKVMFSNTEGKPIVDVTELQVVLDLSKLTYKDIGMIDNDIVRGVNAVFDLNIGKGYENKWHINFLSSGSSLRFDNIYEPNES